MTDHQFSLFVESPPAVKAPKDRRHSKLRGNRAIFMTYQFELFGFVPPRRKKAITPERMEEARLEIQATGWKPNAKTLAKIADQLEELESRIHNKVRL